MTSSRVVKATSSMKNAKAFFKFGQIRGPVLRLSPIFVARPISINLASNSALTIATPQRAEPRGVLRCLATEADDPTEDPRFGRIGKQTIKDTGPLTQKRMETVEDDLLAHSLHLIERAYAAEKPSLLWHNTTRMHVWSVYRSAGGTTKFGLYADCLQDLDWVVGELLSKLDGLGIADNTIVIFATDTGAEKLSWPDGGTSPFRGEKGLGWEGGFRATFVMRWPGTIFAAQVLNGIFSLGDVVPTVMATAGVSDVKEQLLKGYQAGEKHIHVHLDGYN
jgi:arylsulfatase A-like enzyme